MNRLRVHLVHVLLVELLSQISKLCHKFVVWRKVVIFDQMKLFFLLLRAETF